jgi:hypothetical protein
MVQASVDSMHLKEALHVAAVYEVSLDKTAFLNTLKVLETAEQYICKFGSVKNIELGEKVESELYRWRNQEQMIKVTLVYWLK